MQNPGTCQTTDLSEKLQQDGYFGSYNTAYDPSVRRLSGADASEREYGDWFSYNRTARVSEYTYGCM